MLRKIFKWIGIAIAALAVIAAGFYAWNAYNNRPKMVTALEGISLGASMDEVTYALGIPPVVLKPMGSEKRLLEEVTKDEMVKNKTTHKDYFDWHYDNDYFRTSVTFDPATKTVIELGCYASEKQRPVAYCTVNGIGPGTKEDKVVDQLGAPSRSSIDNEIKRIEYDNWNMTVYLQKREAYYILVRELKQPKVTP